MSSVHIASAANEVAHALPSTATVTISKHGISAIETLNLDAQTATQDQLMWSRTFSGTEILTNPTIHYRTVTSFTSGDFLSLEVFNAWRESIRLTSDPIANAASKVSVTLNNTSTSINPTRDHRLVSTFFPSESNDHQRKHYGLNQLDQYAEPYWRSFQHVSQDNVEQQHNTNALRENYPAKWYCAFDGSTYTQVGEEDFYIPAVNVVNVGNVAPASAPQVIQVVHNGMTIGYLHLDSATDPATGGGSRSYAIVKTSDGSATFSGEVDIDDVATLSSKQWKECVFQPRDTDTDITMFNFSQPYMANYLQLRWNGTGTGLTPTGGSHTTWKVVHDVFQPLVHPYFEDDVMRNNTLVNVRYFDCQIALQDKNRLIESSSFKLGARSNDRTLTTELLLKNSSVANISGISPQLIFDLITPSVPLPTISDKLIKTYHTITSSPVSTGTTPYTGLQSGNIQLAQVPDKIYVFVRSSFDTASIAKHTDHVPTRLGVITNLRVRTPQNSAFLINMEQESLYQMACRNGSKQSRSAFMCSLGSVIAIDPEKDLGGYTNGVLIPFTFDVQVDFSLPLRSGSETNSIISGKDLKGLSGFLKFMSTSGEQWTLHVVCELNGHLYLMSDGTGKQTKSNLTVTEVADAVADGIHHPSTFPAGRVQKMDAGILGEVSKSPIGEETRPSSLTLKQWMASPVEFSNAVVWNEDRQPTKDFLYGPNDLGRYEYFNKGIVPTFALPSLQYYVPLATEAQMVARGLYPGVQGIEEQAAKESLFKYRFMKTLVAREVPAGQ